MENVWSIVWPCTRVKFEGYPTFFFKLNSDVKEPQVMCVSDFNWVACMFRFRSPYWQAVNVPKVFDSMSVAIRRVQCGAITPLLEIAADNGWWSLETTLLKDTAETLKTVVPKGASKFEIALQLTKKVKDCGVQGALQCLKHGLASHADTTEFGDELLELDEVDEVLTMEDQRNMKDAQKRALEAKHVSEEFIKEYRHAAETLRDEAAEAEKKKKKKPNKADAPPEDRMPLCSTLSHADAKIHVPDGGHIWRNLVTGAWCSHYPPFRRFSVSWSVGQSESLRRVLRDLWQKYCLVHGIRESECPKKGILDSDPIPLPP